jgi:MFS family permease
MLPMQLLKSKYFTGASITMIFITAGMMAGSFLISFFLTNIMKLSVLDSGLTIIAMPIAMIVLSLIAGPISHKLGARPFAILGIILVSLSVYLFGTLNVDSSRFDVMWRLVICGAGIGMSISPLMASAIKNAPRDKVGIASGIANVSRTIGMVLGVAIIATLLSNNMRISGLRNYVSYDNTFKSFSLILIFGVIFAIFGDKSYKNKDIRM